MKEGQRLLAATWHACQPGTTAQICVPKPPPVRGTPGCRPGQPGRIVGLTAPLECEQSPRGYEAEHLGKGELHISAYFLHSAVSHTSTAWT